MRLRELATTPNLLLAWRRISTGANYQHKRFFRHLYHAYELALDDNLRDLRARLLSRSWQPSSPERIYQPKASGLQRPLTILGIEDQIVLQALANLMAKRLSPRRRPFLLKSVFSNVAQGPQSIFFLQDWHQTYAKFSETVEAHFRAGRRWVADFDLAAFYETISHDLLLRTASPRLRDSDDARWLKQCLSTWTAHKSANSIGHGLPQGPIASDFLAEVFLLPVDEAMASFPGDVRYVDDVRLFAKTATEIRQAVIQLEIHCRERGLIPQVGKFAVREARSLREARGMLPSVGATQDSTTPPLSRSAAEKLIKPALGGRPLRVLDKTRLRYVLYRASPSPRILKIACLLLVRHPEHVDAIAAYLAQYSYRKSIRDCCLGVLAMSPYEYVQGEMWHILARFYPHPETFNKAGRRRYIQRAIGVLKDQSTGVAVKWGAAHFICSAEKASGVRHTRCLRRQRGILQSIIAPALDSKGVSVAFLRASAIEPSLGLAAPLLAAGIFPRTLGVRASELSRQAANVFRRLGLISTKWQQLDVIGEIIEKRYAVPSKGHWRRLLKAEYVHAAGMLVQADTAFKSAPSYWLSHQNSFNQAAFLALQRHLNRKGLPGAIKIHDAKGALVDYGATLDQNAAFSKAYPKIADTFRALNQRRNKLPASHPYEKKSSAKTKYLTGQERNAFVAPLRLAYQELLTLIV
jgi:hypothetical protein